MVTRYETFIGFSPQLTAQHGPIMRRQTSTRIRTINIEIYVDMTLIRVSAFPPISVSLMTVFVSHLEADAEREGEGGEHHGPGDGGEDPAAHADTIVSVVRCNTATIISCS